MRSAHGLCAASMLALLGACGNGNAGKSPIVPPADAVRIDTAPAPDTYSAAIPGSAKKLAAWLHGENPVPPRSHVLDHITDGDTVWLSRFQFVALNMPAEEREAWTRIWARALDFSEVSPKFCEITRPWMSGHGPDRAALIELFTRACATAADRAAIVREDTPAWAVVRFFDPWQRQRRVAPGAEYDPRLIAAAREIMLSEKDAGPPPRFPLDLDDPKVIEQMAMMGSARETAFTLASIRDARVQDALLKIHAEIGPRKVADDVAMAFTSSPDPRFKKIADAACARRPNDPSCDPRNRRIALTTDYGQDHSADTPAPAAGPTYSFDAETDRYPNGHDSLMRHLAALVSPTLDTAVFEETAPAVEDEKSPYEIRAYSGGQRFRRRAINHGDWYDIEAVLDLMNALMFEHRRAERFHVLTSDGQMVTVVVATPEAMMEAAEAGLAGSSDPDRARKAGQDAERRVFEQLDKK